MGGCRGAVRAKNLTDCLLVSPLGFGDQVIRGRGRLSAPLHHLGLLTLPLSGSDGSVHQSTGRFPLEFGHTVVAISTRGPLGSGARTTTGRGVIPGLPNHPHPW